MKKFLLLLSIFARISFAADCTPDHLSEKFERMYDEDQALRKEYTSARSDQQNFPKPENEEKVKRISQTIIASDQQNRQSLDQIVSECGWPELKNLSYKAYYAVFLTVQHAEEAAYRQKYFPYFQKQYEAKAFRTNLFAMLVDRIRLIDEGKPQLYATHTDPSKNGISTYMEVEDPENLNNRREQMGLSRITMFDDLYLPKTDKAAINMKARKKELPQ